MDACKCYKSYKKWIQGVLFLFQPQQSAGLIQMHELVIIYLICLISFDFLESNLKDRNFNNNRKKREDATHTKVFKDNLK